MSPGAKGITRAFTGDSLTLTAEKFSQVLRYDAFGFATSDEVCADPDCPKINDPLPENPALKVSDVRPDRQGFNLWWVYVTYSVPDDGDSHPGKNAANSQDPTTLPTEWDWDDGLDAEPVDRDVNGIPITNSARDPVNNPPPNTFSSLVIVGYKWYRGFDIDRANRFRNKTNSDIWRPSGSLFGGKSIPKGTAKCTSIKPVGRLTSSAKFVQVMHRFELRADGWKFRMMDVGRRMNAVANNIASVQPIVLTQPPKAPITDDVRLDGKGRPLDLKSYEPLFGKTDPQNNIPFPGPEIEVLQDAVFLKWTLLKEDRFADLNL